MEPDTLIYKIPGSSNTLMFDVQSITHRIIQDCLLEATVHYWRQRAEAFEQARPQPGDNHYGASAAEVAERDERLAGIAQACRYKAAGMEIGWL